MDKIRIFIGFERASRIPAYVLADSLIENSSIPVEIVFLHKGTLRNFFSRPRGKYDSTEFSISRFLVPYLSDYKGWSLYIDNDMIVEKDVAELSLLMNGDYTIKCTKHNQIVDIDVKFLGEKQTAYNMKNWSSVMIFNNAKCKVLTPEYVNSAPGLDLHQFKWVKDIHKEIGSIPLEWNYLADVNSVGQELVNKPSLIHYTNGGPFYKATSNCEYSKNWLKVYNRINDYQKG
ncbi:glycosyltransferase [Methylophilaceae bacterium]|nr:glycosyltransferase [Methylophilaceae bacterium]